MTATIDVDRFLQQQSDKDQLRFIICGSVDDGKSTLLGRLLYDAKSIFEDQLSNAKSESKKYGTQGADIDLALLIDGLQAEREQGITIDVAYRYFATEQRKFIAIDAPGHEQYTRNMATGASNAELAIVLIDASQGLLTQTCRHSYIVSLLGIKRVVVAVNKMDLVGYEQAIFDHIIADYQQLAGQLAIANFQAIPVSALKGDNVFTTTDAMPWYKGNSLMEVLNQVDIGDNRQRQAFRMPVQRAHRPNLQFRGFSGTISAGSVAVGDAVVSCISSKTSSIKAIHAGSGQVQQAIAGQAVTLELNDEIDISRGDMLSSIDHQPELADQFAAHIIWMDTEPMLPERSYNIRFTTALTSGRITDLVHQIDVNNHQRQATKKLDLNAVGYCKIALDRALPFDAYQTNQQTGAFVLIDKYSNQTVGAGMIEFALRRATNIEWHNMKVDKQLRAQHNHQKPCVIWFTGFSGSGKSTIADRLEQRLHTLGKRTYLLDGDNVRHGLNQDLGFTDQDRVENIRRVGEVAKLMVDAGLMVLTSFISPFRAERQMARKMFESDEFIEVFVDTPIEICEQRDPKGLYKKARLGELKNFTGIDSDYEIPDNADLILNTSDCDVDSLVEQIITYLNTVNESPQ